MTRKAGDKTVSLMTYPADFVQLDVSMFPMTENRNNVTTVWTSNEVKLN